MKIKRKIRENINKMQKMILKIMQKIYVIENIFMDLWKKIGVKKVKGAI